MFDENPGSTRVSTLIFTYKYKLMPKWYLGSKKRMITAEIITKEILKHYTYSQ
jgi:hypothetical protein